MKTRQRIELRELFGFGPSLDLGHGVNYEGDGDPPAPPAPPAGDPPPAPPASDFSSMTMADMQSLVPEDLRENGVFSKYTEVPEFFKGITELATLAGKKGDIPTDWEDEGAVNAFWDKLGRPAEKSEYDFAMPENFEFSDPNYLEKVSEAAHAAGMPKTMLAKFMAPIMEYEAARAKDIADGNESAKTAAQARMSEEWGDSTQDMLAEVDNVLGHFQVSEEDAKVIKGDTATMLLLGKIANTLGERGQAGATFGKTKAGLNAQLDELNDRITSKLGENGRNMNDPTLTPLLEKRERLQDRLNA